MPFEKLFAPPEFIHNKPLFFSVLQLKKDYLEQCEK